MSAKIKFQPLIESLSGRVGNLCFRTYASGRTTVSAYAPRKRTTPCTQAENNAKQLFAKRARMVNRLAKQYPDKTKSELWTLVKQMDL